MNKIVFALALTVFAACMLMTAFGFNPGDPEKKKAVIKVIRIIDGETTETVDTVYTTGTVGGADDVVIMRRDGRRSRQMVTRPFPSDGAGRAVEREIRVFRRGPNVIDLTDPGIISYKKKKMSNGREKITIIRKEVTEPAKSDEIMEIDRNQELFRIDSPKPVRELEKPEGVPMPGQEIK